MNFLRFIKLSKSKSIIRAYTAGVIGIYTEPLFLALYLLGKIIKCKIVKIKFVLFFVVLAIHGYVMSLFTGYSLDKMAQQLLLIFVVLFGYIQLFHSSKKSIEFWFSVYLNFVYILSVIGLFQFFVYIMTDINIFPYTMELRPTLSSYRLRAIFIEAGHMAYFFIPGTSYIIISTKFYLNNKSRSSIILLASILTFSSSMYISIIIAVVYRFYDHIKKFKFFFYVIALLFVWELVKFNYNAIEYNEETGVRNAFSKIAQYLDAIHYLLSDESSPATFESFNRSTYASLSNLWIALNAPYRVFGTGLGTHQQNYEALYQSDFIAYGLNKEGAYSLFSRILSEFGYIGISLFFLFVFKMYNKYNILSTCYLIFIICAMIKGGHYTMHCTMLFFYLFYQCSNKQIDESKINVCFKRNGMNFIERFS